MYPVHKRNFQEATKPDYRNSFYEQEAFLESHLLIEHSLCNN